MKLTVEESEILKDFEEERLVPSVRDKEILQKFMDGASDFGKKTKIVSIRLPEEDFDAIRIKALQKICLLRL
ncbi:MAG: hypothetical protein R2941_12840 [Desulfobacterales bacterium]